jgi:hypothetical protein
MVRNPVFFGPGRIGVDRDGFRVSLSALDHRYENL